VTGPADIWSPSRVLTYRSCPRQEALRYRRPVTTPAAVTDPREPGQGSVKTRLGSVTHIALQAAYEAAAALPEHRYAGQRMSVFSEVASAALYDAWERLGLPFGATEDDPTADGSLLVQIESEVFDVLARLPVPRPAAILGVEHELVVPTPGGRVMQGVLDLALQIGPDALHIRDWKRRSLQSLPRSTELPRDDAMAFYRFAAHTYWPHLRRVSVGLYSTISNREVIADVALEVAASVVLGQDLLAEHADADRERRPTPDGTNCTYCPVRDDCPAWTQRPDRSRTETA
jgi:hypothetical protein